MATPKFNCGAECRVGGGAAVTIASNAANGAILFKHWTAVAGTVTVDTPPAGFTSSQAFKLVNSAGTGAALTKSFETTIASPATLVMRFKVLFEGSMPTGAGGCTDYMLTGTDSQNLGLGVRLSDNQLFAGSPGTYSHLTGIILQPDTVYEINYSHERNSGTNYRVTVNGVSSQTLGATGISAAIPGFRIMFTPNTGTVTGTVWFDDILVSGTNADYPLPLGTCVGLFPSADGTHSYNATGDFQDGGTAAAALAIPSTSETATWQSLQNRLQTTVDNAKYIKAVGAASTEYLQWLMDDLPSTFSSFNSMTVVMMMHATSTTANSQSITLVDTVNGNGLIAILAAATTNSTSIVETQGLRQTDSTGSTWTKTELDGIQVRWLSPDNNPDNMLDGVCLEVDFVSASVATFTMKGATASSATIDTITRTRKVTAKAATATSAKLTKLNQTKRLTAKAATASNAKVSLTVVRPISVKAATASSAKSAAIKRTRAMAIKAATASSAKVATVTRTRRLTAKAATATSSKSTLRTTRPLSAKAATATSAKETLKVTRGISAKAATSSSANSDLTVTAGGGPVTFSVKMATATGTKATLRTTRPISAKAATATSAKVTQLKRTRPISLKAATASSAKITTITRTRRVSLKAATATSAKTTLRATRAITAKAATATNAKVTARVTRPITVKANTANNAKLTTLVRTRRLALKAQTSSSAKITTLVRTRKVSAKAGSASSAKATARVTRPFSAKAATASGAKATLTTSAPNFVSFSVKMPTATSAKATLRRTAPLSVKAATATKAKATLKVTRGMTAKLSTANSAKATTFKRVRGISAKAATATGAKVATVRMTKTFTAKLPTASSMRVAVVVSSGSTIPLVVDVALLHGIGAAALARDVTIGLVEGAGVQCLPSDVEVSGGQ